MKSIATKVDNTSTLPANAFNSIADELENAVTKSGQTLDATPETAVDPSPVQLSRAMTQAVLSASAYTDSGAANGYVLTAVGTWQQPTTYIAGSQVRFTAANSNSGASTVNVAAIGVKSIVRQDGTALLSGDIVAAKEYTITFDATNDRFVLRASRNPMTAVGDLIYGGISGEVTRLAPNTTTTKQFLSGTGTGSVGQAPAWGALAVTDVPVSLTAYTPTTTGGNVNMAALGGKDFKWYRVGNIVTVIGSITLTTTAGSTGTPTASAFRFTLPVAPTSNFTNDSWSDCNGMLSLAGSGAADAAGNIRAYNSGATNEATAAWSSKTTSGLNFAVNFSYRVA